jgi:hypothetical protein
MKLLNRLRELRSESNIRSNIEETNTTNSQYQDLIGVGSTTLDDILRLNIAETHPRSFYHHQD